MGTKLEAEGDSEKSGLVELFHREAKSLAQAVAWIQIIKAILMLFLIFYAIYQGFLASMDTSLDQRELNNFAVELLCHGLHYSSLMIVATILIKGIEMRNTNYMRTWVIFNFFYFAIDLLATIIYFGGISFYFRWISNILFDGVSIWVVLLHMHDTERSKEEEDEMEQKKIGSRIAVIQKVHRLQEEPDPEVRGNCLRRKSMIKTMAWFQITGFAFLSVVVFLGFLKVLEDGPDSDSWKDFENSCEPDCYYKLLGLTSGLSFFCILTSFMGLVLLKGVKLRQAGYLRVWIVYSLMVCFLFVVIFKVTSHNETFDVLLRLLSIVLFYICCITPVMRMVKDIEKARVQQQMPDLKVVFFNEKV